MSTEVAVASLKAVGDYVESNDPDHSAAIVLHGGEPSLWPGESFQAFADELARQRERGLKIDCGMQTNGLKLPSSAVLDLLREHRIGLGFSLDGPKFLNDAFRPDFAGRGSYDRILGNVERLQADGYEELVGGFLCVVQPEIDPNAFLDWIRTLPLTRVDLLWPLEYNHQNPPWTIGGEEAYALSPRYGDWLSALFEAWWQLDDPDIYIRLFRFGIEARIGGVTQTDSLGPGAFESLVINTDGAIELTDYFRTAVDGGTFTGYSILTDSIAAVVSDKRVKSMRRAAFKIPAACKTCRHRPICGGGTLAGRLDETGEILAVPSVLCSDHMRYFDTLADHVDAAMAGSVSPNLARQQ